MLRIPVCKCYNMEERREINLNTDTTKRYLTARRNKVKELWNLGYTVDEIAREVIHGDWGNGSDRKKRITSAGYDYSAVQKRVNELLK